MELCSDNLQNIIKEKPRVFKRQSSDAMNSIEFHISCQLFREILECVQYIHGLNPPIIHRDLKPANILINKIPKNGYFIKLCDFGLSTLQYSMQTMTRTAGAGTFKYMAPEVFEQESGKSRFTTKADVYSLGKIFQDLLDFDINS